MGATDENRDQGAGGGNGGSNLWNRFRLDVAPVLGVVLAVVLLVVLMRMYLSPGLLLERLTDEAYARGVITFTVTLSAVAMALMITASALFGNQTDKEEDRFRRAREVFGAFAGILGTVVGFYFGASTTEQKALAVEGLKIERTAGGRAVTVAGRIAGGTPPYRYDVLLDGQMVVENAVSEDGWLLSELTEVPGPAGKLKVTDRSHAKVEVDFDVPGEPPNDGPPAAPTPSPSREPEVSSLG